MQQPEHLSREGDGRAGRPGGRLKALKLDLWIIFANDHAEQFFHNVAPAFTVHVGGSAKRRCPI